MPTNHKSLPITKHCKQSGILLLIVALRWYLDLDDKMRNTIKRNRGLLRGRAKSKQKLVHQDGANNHKGLGRVEEWVEETH